jgi:hypothetical protein
MVKIRQIKYDVRTHWAWFFYGYDNYAEVSNNAELAYGKIKGLVKSLFILIKPSACFMRWNFIWYRLKDLWAWSRLDKDGYSFAIKSRLDVGREFYTSSLAPWQFQTP